MLNDSLPFTTYIQALNRGSAEEPSQKKPDSPGEDSNGHGHGDDKVGTTVKAEPTHYTVYVKSHKLPTEINDDTKES